MAITEAKIEETHNKVDTSLDTVEAKAKEVFTKIKGVFDATKSDMGIDFDRRLQEITNQKINQIQAAARNENEEELTKELAIFPDLFLSGAICFQTRYLNKQGKINKYGDVYFAGNFNATGVGAPAEGGDKEWRRYGVPYGTEIEEIVSDGVGVWGIVKGRKIAYFSGICADDTTRSRHETPTRMPGSDREFESPIKKILVGRVSNTYLNNSSNFKYAKHLAIIILEDGTIYAFGTNEGYECGQGNNNKKKYEQLVKITVECTDATKDANPLPGEQFIPDDGAVGFSGYRGTVILIGTHKNESDKSKRVAYGWGSNKDDHLPTFKGFQSYGDEYKDSNSNNKAYKKPVRLNCRNDKHYPHKVWIIAGQKGFGNDDWHFQTYMNLTSDKGAEGFYGCGYTKERQIKEDTSKSTIDEFFTQSKSGGNPLPKAIDVQGTSCGSMIVGIFPDEHNPRTEKGKPVGELWVCGYLKANVGVLGKSGESVIWSRLTRSQSTSKIWFFNDTNPNEDPKSKALPSIFFVEEGTTTKLELTGYNPGYGTTGEWVYEPASGFETIDGGYKLVDIRQGLAISSASYLTPWKGALVYGISPDKRRIVVRGGDQQYQGFSVIEFVHRDFMPIEGMPEIVM